MSLDSGNTSDSQRQQAFDLLDDPDRRSEGIEQLRDYGDEQVRDRIRPMLGDSDEIVRIESIEYLEAWKDEKSIPLILRCLQDEEGLVVRYAACALARMGVQEVIPVCEKILESDGCGIEQKTGCGFALCLLGKPEGLFYLLEAFFTDWHGWKCGAANLLPEIVDEKSVNFVRGLLKTLLELESSRAARSSYEYALECLCDYYPEE